jgi:DNA-binding IscR family transcriptional regulator
VALASEPSGGAANVAELARRTGAPPDEVRAVGELLQKAGLAEASAGGNGSLTWRRDAATVSLYEIAQAVGEPFEVCGLRKDGASSRAAHGDCALEAFLAGLKTEVIDLFKARKLSKLVAGRA